MTSPRRLTLLLVPIAALSVPVHPAHAFDMTGAWATDAAACERLFVRKGKSFAFRPEFDVSGGGFIVDGPSIKGRSINCTIKQRHENGPTFHLLASCASDVMLSDVQFSVKIVNENRLTWHLPRTGGRRDRLRSLRVLTGAALASAAHGADGRAKAGPKQPCGSAGRLSSGNGRP